ASEMQVANAPATGVVGPLAVPSKSRKVTPASPPTALIAVPTTPTFTVLTALLPVAGGTTSGMARGSCTRGSTGAAGDAAVVVVFSGAAGFPVLGQLPVHGVAQS